MKKVIIVLSFLMWTGISQAQSVEDLLDTAVSLQEKGDHEGLADALTKASTGIESEVEETGGDFKEGLLSQVGGLKKMIPTAASGLLNAATLKKVVGTIKMLLGGNRLGNLLGAGSLIGKASSLTSGLDLMKVGSSVLGSGGSDLSKLIDGAMGGVSKLDGNAMLAKSAEPVVKQQLGGILDMAKGLF